MEGVRHNGALDSGVVMVNVLTDLPDVSAEMWDWWIGWHGRETARYKLCNHSIPPVSPGSS